MRIVRPTTKWGRITVWLGILCLLLWIADSSERKVDGWAVFATLVFAFLALVMFCRWGYRPLLWRLRNRLIVTYLFIGVMPILLLLLMGGVAGYLFAGQFATYVAISDLHSELLHLQAANDALAAQLFPLENAGKLDEQVAGEFTRASDERFPAANRYRVAQAKTVSYSPPREELLATASGRSSGFHQRRLYRIRRRSRCPASAGDQALSGQPGRMALISDLPITPNLLLPTAERLGMVTLLPLPQGDTTIRRAESNAGRAPGKYRLRSHWFDMTLRFPTLFDVVDWQTGEKQEYGLIDVATRPSMLYATLFATLGDKALIVRDFCWPSLFSSA